MAFIQGQHMGMVVLGHGDHGLAVERPTAPLVHRVPGDGGRGGAGPVQSVPSSVISQALHWPHICKISTDILTDRANQTAANGMLGFIIIQSGSFRPAGFSYFSWLWLCNYFYHFCCLFLLQPKLIVFCS